jgi:hypothetical protein
MMKIDPRILALGCTGLLFATAAYALAPGPHEMLERFDANRDGLFSPAEIDAAIAGIYAHVDRDHDGRLTANELRAFHGGAQPGKDGVDGDADGDGAVSLAEFTAHARGHIAAADSNGDGQLSMAEMEAMHKGRHGAH